MVGGGDPLLPEILSPSSNLLLLVKTERLLYFPETCVANLAMLLLDLVISSGRLLVIHI